MSAATQGVPSRTFSSHNRAAAFALIVLAPLIGEVLSGATRLSFLFAFVPEMMVWGCGALIAREAVRRWRGGWTSLLLLGIALAVAEEIVIQQTSLAPLPWPAPSAGYGRLWGVNWIYFLFMLGYESVWIVLVPVQFADLIFVKDRDEPWLGNTGLIVSSVVFLLGAAIAWFLWIKRARAMVFHVPTYNPPLAAVLGGVLAIALLACMAYALRNVGGQAPAASRVTAPAWTAGLAAVVFGLPWYGLMSLIFGVRRSWPFWIPALAALLWATLAYVTLRYLSSAPGWRDSHRWALAFGATLVCMAAGYSGSHAWPHKDLIAKSILNVLAVAGFLLLAWRIRQRRLEETLS